MENGAKRVEELLREKARREGRSLDEVGREFSEAWRALQKELETARRFHRMVLRLQRHYAFKRGDAGAVEPEGGVLPDRELKDRYHSAKAARRQYNFGVYALDRRVNVILGEDLVRFGVLPGCDAPHPVSGSVDDNGTHPGSGRTGSHPGLDDTLGGDCGD